jgi:FkbM family methyltransferase
MYNSQDNQDKYLEESVFKGYKNGFFVDVGAHNGISFNNTLYFEKYNNWKGINIEPLEKVYNELVENRPNCINKKCVISNYTGIVDFISNNGYTEMLSGIKEHYDEKHLQRLIRENHSEGSTTEIIKIKSERLETVLEENNITRINYLSIDVEGGEYEVIKSINFDKVFIDVISFEDNYSDSKTRSILQYLEEKGYVRLNKIGADIFMIHKNSVFNS